MKKTILLLVFMTGIAQAGLFDWEKMSVDSASFKSLQKVAIVELDKTKPVTAGFSSDTYTVVRSNDGKFLPDVQIRVLLDMFYRTFVRKFKETFPDKVFMDEKEVAQNQDFIKLTKLDDKKIYYPGTRMVYKQNKIATNICRALGTDGIIAVDLTIGGNNAYTNRNILILSYMTKIQIFNNKGKLAVDAIHYCFATNYLIMQRALGDILVRYKKDSGGLFMAFGFGATKEQKAEYEKSVKESEKKELDKEMAEIDGYNIKYPARNDIFTNSTLLADDLEKAKPHLQNLTYLQQDLDQCVDEIMDLMKKGVK